MKDINFYAHSIDFKVPSDYYNDDIGEQIYPSDLPKLLDCIAMMIDCCSPDDDSERHKEAAAKIVEVAEHVREHSEDFDKLATEVTKREFANALFLKAEDREQWEKKMREAKREPSWEAWNKRIERLYELAAEGGLQPGDETPFLIKDRSDGDKLLAEVKFIVAGNAIRYRAEIHKDGKKHLVPGNDWFPSADKAVRIYADWEAGL